MRHSPRMGARVGYPSFSPKVGKAWRGGSPRFPNDRGCQSMNLSFPNSNWTCSVAGDESAPVWPRGHHLHRHSGRAGQRWAEADARRGRRQQPRIPGRAQVCHSVSESRVELVATESAMTSKPTEGEFPHPTGLTRLTVAPPRSTRGCRNSVNFFAHLFIPNQTIKKGFARLTRSPLIGPR